MISPDPGLRAQSPSLLLPRTQSGVWSAVFSQGRRSGGSPTLVRMGRPAGADRSWETEALLGGSGGSEGAASGSRFQAAKCGVASAHLLSIRPLPPSLKSQNVNQISGHLESRQQRSLGNALFSLSGKIKESVKMETKP